jgi:hypothetical protein
MILVVSVSGLQTSDLVSAGRKQSDSAKTEHNRRHKINVECFIVVTTVEGGGSCRYYVNFVGHTCEASKRVSKHDFEQMRDHLRTAISYENLLILQVLIHSTVYVGNTEHDDPEKCCFTTTVYIISSNCYEFKNRKICFTPKQKHVTVVRLGFVQERGATQPQ